MKKLYNVFYTRQNARYKFVDTEKDVTLMFTISHRDGAITGVKKVSKGRTYLGYKYYKTHMQDIHEAIQKGAVHK